MFSFPRNSFPSSVSTTDQSDYDGRYRSHEYGEPTMVEEHDGPYWVRPIREHEVDAAHESYHPAEDIYGEAQRWVSDAAHILPKSDHNSIHETREDSTASGRVPHEHKSSHKVDRSISTHQQSASRGYYDEEV